MGLSRGHMHRGSHTAAHMGSGVVQVLLHSEPHSCHTMSPGQLGIGGGDGGDGGGGTGHGTRSYRSQLTGQLLSASFVPHSPSPSHFSPICTWLQLPRVAMAAWARQALLEIACTQQVKLMVSGFSCLGVSMYGILHALAQTSRKEQ